MKIDKVLSGVQNLNTFMEGAKKILGEVRVSKRDDKTIPVHCNLAASYGTLNKESIKKMDEELKVIIAGTVRMMQRTKDYSWKNIQSIMNQNSLLRIQSGSEIYRADKLLKNGNNCFKFDGSPDKSIVNEVHSWFKKLIADKDVLADTKIDIDLMAKIVAASGASIDSFVSFFYKSVYYERTVVDVGIIRYPDLDNPYFKLYRIFLKAWSDCRRILFHQQDKNGISGTYNCVRYVPRESVLKRLRAATIDKAVDEAEDLFS